MVKELVGIEEDSNVIQEDEFHPSNCNFLLIMLFNILTWTVFFKGQEVVRKVQKQRHDGFLLYFLQIRDT